MEIDVELNLNVTPERADVLAKVLAPSLEIRRFKRRQGVGIRWREGFSANAHLDSVIRDFMKLAKQVVSTADTQQAELRVGVFLEQDEAVSMTALLSATTVHMLAELDLAVEVSFYPCDEAGDEKVS